MKTIFFLRQIFYLALKSVLEIAIIVQASLELKKILLPPPFKG